MDLVIIFIIIALIIWCISSRKNINKTPIISPSTTFETKDVILSDLEKKIFQPSKCSKR